MTSRASLAAFVVLGLLKAASAPPGVSTQQKGTKLLFGFEEDDFRKIGATRREDGVWRADYGYPYDFHGLTGEDASQGRMSKVTRFRTGWVGGMLKARWAGKPPGDGRGYGGWCRNKSLYVGRMLLAYGWRKRLERDWSGFPKLWMDVKSTDAPAVIEIQVEDDFTPTAMFMGRKFKIPAGKWVTLEYDLAGARDARVLDPARIACFYVLATKIQGPTNIFLDNIRLASAEAQARFPVVRDTSPWPKYPEPPGENGKTTRPRKPAPVKIQWKAISREEKPAVITVKKPCSWGDNLRKQPRGIAAFGDRNMVLVSVSPSLNLRLSSDGGRTWKGIEGDDYTVLCKGNNSVNRHGFYCSPTEVLGLYTTTCSGGCLPTNTYFRRAFFDGETWKLQAPTVVDSDVRHCPNWYDVIRLPNGRLWACWDHLDRRGQVTIRTKFSDDDGLTWQHGGRLGTVCRARFRSLPTLAAYGEDGVAILWHRRDSKRIFFSRFNQGKFDKMYAAYLAQPPSQKQYWDRFATETAWTDPQPLPEGQRLSSVLGLPDGRIFAAVSRPAAILVWNGKTWKESLADCTGLLTRCGTDKIAVFYVSADGTRILYRLMAGAKWGAARTAFTEQSRIRTIAVPRVSPPDWVPVAWTLRANKHVIRVLRVSAK